MLSVSNIKYECITCGTDNASEWRPVDVQKQGSSNTGRGRKNGVSKVSEVPIETIEERNELQGWYKNSISTIYCFR